MTTHTITNPDKWREARLDLMAAEKDLVRRSDEVAELRRKLPWVRVDEDNVFDGRTGPITLGGLFDGRRQLIVQHFMFAPDWEEGCPSCSFMADHSDGMVPHLEQRDTSFVVISRAPLEQIETFRRRMGWHFNWVSSFGTRFNYDFGVSFTPEEIASGKIDYNFGSWSMLGQEWPGVSVFFKDEDGQVFRTYSTYGRGVEVMMGTYRMLDLTPLGRDEPPQGGMGWVRHHDKYKERAGQEPSGAEVCCEAHAGHHGP